MNTSVNQVSKAPEALLQKIISRKSTDQTVMERIGFPDSNNLVIDSAIRSQEMQSSLLENLQKELRLDKEVFLDLVNIAPATYSRRKRTNQSLKSDEAGRVFRISSVLALTEEVLGSHERALAWLKTPAKFLNGKEPLDLIKTEAGAEAVKNLLFRIEHSVYS